MATGRLSFDRPSSARPAAARQRSARVDALRRAVASVASTTAPVLLVGAAGADVEGTARAIHRASGRPGAWVPVYCAAINRCPCLAEVELIGYVKGLPGPGRAGYVEQASGGTLFLDSVGDLPREVQSTLSRVLEDRVVRRVGARRSKTIDVRVIAATHVDLETSGFRRDLLAWLSDRVIRLPRLAERRVDIPELWDGPRAHFAMSSKREVPRPTDGVGLRRRRRVLVHARGIPRRLSVGAGSVPPKRSHGVGGVGESRGCSGLLGEAEPAPRLDEPSRLRGR